MSMEIAHKNGQKKILKKALLLFTEQCYSSVIFQKIAYNCGKSRTTLYSYFHDKRETMDEGLKNGELHPVNLRISGNLLYSQLKTLAFRLIVRWDADPIETTERLENVLFGLQAHEKNN